MRILAAVFFLIFGTSVGALAQSISSDLSPTNVPTLRVEIDDQADDGCWTNLAEVKTYAEDKLELMGYALQDAHGGYDFNITVVAFRMPNNVCSASYTITVESLKFADGLFGFHVMASHNGIVTRRDNLNTFVLEKVQDITDAMRGD